MLWVVDSLNKVIFNHEANGPAVDVTSSLDLPELQHPQFH